MYVSRCGIEPTCMGQCSNQTIIFLKYIFDSWVIEFADIELSDTESQLYHFWIISHFGHLHTHIQCDDTVIIEG